MVEGAGDKAGQLARRIVGVKRKPAGDDLFPLLAAYVGQQRGLAESDRRPQDGEPTLEQRVEPSHQRRPAHMAGRRFRDRELHT